MEAFCALLALCEGNPLVTVGCPSLIDSPHKGQSRGALMFSLICPWINSWSKQSDAGDLRRHRAHYNVTVQSSITLPPTPFITKKYRTSRMQSPCVSGTITMKVVPEHHHSLKTTGNIRYSTTTKDWNNKHRKIKSWNLRRRHSIETNCEVIDEYEIYHRYVALMTT